MDELEKALSEIEKKLTMLGNRHRLLVNELKERKIESQNLKAQIEFLKTKRSNTINKVNLNNLRDKLTDQRQSAKMKRRVSQAIRSIDESIAIIEQMKASKEGNE